MASLIPNNNKPLINYVRSINRNDRCPCGSLKKYKNCHLPMVFNPYKNVEENNAKSKALV